MDKRRWERMKRYLGFISVLFILLVIGLFIGNIYSLFSIEVTTFRIIMIGGIALSVLSSLLSEKGTFRKLTLGFSIIIGVFYLIGIELMRVVFQGNGF